MITCYIRYRLDPGKVADFETYATAWPPIIARCGGELIGYFLPKEGDNDLAIALIDFPSLADYERYREQLAADADAQRNVAFGLQSSAIRSEGRSFLRRV